MDFKELCNQVKKQKEAINKRYHLARSLGFSAREATILQNLKEKTIRGIAEHRDSLLNSQSK